MIETFPLSAGMLERPHAMAPVCQPNKKTELPLVLPGLVTETYARTPDPSLAGS